MSESRTERLGPGICDGCGEEKPILTAIYCAPIAGVCLCDDCLRQEDDASARNEENLRKVN